MLFKARLLKLARWSLHGLLLLVLLLLCVSIAQVARAEGGVVKRGVWLADLPDVTRVQPCGNQGLAWAWSEKGGIWIIDAMGRARGPRLLTDMRVAMVRPRKDNMSAWVVANESLDPSMPFDVSRLFSVACTEEPQEMRALFEDHYFSIRAGDEGVWIESGSSEIQTLFSFYRPSVGTKPVLIDSLNGVLVAADDKHAWVLSYQRPKGQPSQAEPGSAIFRNTVSVLSARRMDGRRDTPTWQLPIGKIRFTRLTPSGRLVVGSYDPPAVYLLDPDRVPLDGGKALIRLPAKRRDPRQPRPDDMKESSWRPELNHIAGDLVWLARDSGEQILVLDAEAGQLLHGGAELHPGKALSIHDAPGTDRIWLLDSAEILVHRLNGNVDAKKAVPQLEMRRTYPSLSPDGTYMWFASEREIYRAHLTDGTIDLSGPIRAPEKVLAVRAMSNGTAIFVYGQGHLALVRGDKLEPVQLEGVSIDGSKIRAAGDARVWFKGSPSNTAGDHLYLLRVLGDGSPDIASLIADNNINPNEMPAAGDKADRIFVDSRGRGHVFGTADDIHFAEVTFGADRLDLGTKPGAAVHGSPSALEATVKLKWHGMDLLASGARTNDRLSLEMRDEHGALVASSGAHPLTWNRGAPGELDAIHFPVTPRGQDPLKPGALYRFRVTYTDGEGRSMFVEWPDVRFQEPIVPPPPLHKHVAVRTALFGLAIIALALLLLFAVKDARAIRPWIVLLTSVFGGASASISQLLAKDAVNISLVGLAAMLGGAFVIFCVSGVISIPLYRELLEIEPFAFALKALLRRPGMRRRFYKDYVARLGSWIEESRREARGEEYVDLPVVLTHQGNLTELPPGNEPAARIWTALVSDRSAAVTVLVKAPGGRGKSALLRRIVEVALAEWQKNPELPLPLRCSGSAATILDEFKEPDRIDRNLVSPEYLKQCLRDGAFFLVLDGLSELRDGELSPKALTEHFKSHYGARASAVLTTRPHAGFERAFAAAERRLLAEPEPLRGEALAQFVKKYAPPDAREDEAALGHLIIQLEPLQSRGIYSAILVRLALASWDPQAGLGAANLGDVYRRAFNQLLATNANAINIDTVARLCVETYWQDASRTLDYASATQDRRTLLDTLLAAGIVVAESSAREEPKKVRFFHDSMQSYLTALGLYQAKRWDAFRGAAGRPDLRKQHAELFEMCVKVFHPAEKVVFTLRSDLYLWAGSAALRSVTVATLLQAAPEEVRPTLRDLIAATDPSAGTFLRAAADACAGDLELLSDLYVETVPRLVELETAAGAGDHAPVAAVGELARLDANQVDELVRLLAIAYPSLGLLRVLGQNARVDLVDWRQSDRMGEAIRDLLALASMQGRLRAMLQHVLQDQSKVAVHARIQELAQQLNPPAVAVAAFNQ